MNELEMLETTAKVTGGFFVLFGGLIFFLAVVSIAVYVLSSIGISKVLGMYGYANKWHAWIPFLNYYALATVALGDSKSYVLFGKDIPAAVFKFWWVSLFVTGLIPFVGGILGIAIQVICFGTVYTLIYSALENKTIEECKVLGYVSSIIGIIPLVKFLMYKK